MSKKHRVSQRAQAWMEQNMEPEQAQPAMDMGIVEESRQLRENIEKVGWAGMPALGQCVEEIELHSFPPLEYSQPQDPNRYNLIPYLAEMENLERKIQEIEARNRAEMEKRTHASQQSISLTVEEMKYQNIVLTQEAFIKQMTAELNRLAKYLETECDFGNVDATIAVNCAITELGELNARKFIAESERDEMKTKWDAFLAQERAKAQTKGTPDHGFSR